MLKEAFITTELEAELCTEEASLHRKVEAGFDGRWSRSLE